MLSRAHVVVGANGAENVFFHFNVDCFGPIDGVSFLFVPHVLLRGFALVLPGARFVSLIHLSFVYAVTRRPACRRADFLDSGRFNAGRQLVGLDFGIVFEVLVIEAHAFGPVPGPLAAGVQPGIALP